MVGKDDHDGLGMGSCAAVLLQPVLSQKELVTTDVFNVLADNVEAEILFYPTEDAFVSLYLHPACIRSSALLIAGHLECAN